MLPYREISADKWADGNLLKLKWKSNVLHMGRTKPMHQYRLWTWKAAWQKKTWEPDGQVEREPTTRHCSKGGQQPSGLL